MSGRKGNPWRENHWSCSGKNLVVSSFCVKRNLGKKTYFLALGAATTLTLL